MGEKSRKWQDYELLDSGDGRKLERFGPYRFSRPCPQALWAPELKEWTDIQAKYIRSSSGGGDWTFFKRVPETWTVSWRDVVLRLKPTGFGHLGVFPEQHQCWEWIYNKAKSCRSPISVLNLFGYTGGASLAAAKAGARVCHVDSSKGIVNWARDNAGISGLKDHPIRWIVDDVMKFVAREVRRGKRYEGIVLDPPSFGRGSKGQVWKIDKDIYRLLELLQVLMGNDGVFFLMTCHSQHLSIPGLKNLIQPMVKDSFQLEVGDITIKPSHGVKLLPSGLFARWA